MRALHVLVALGLSGALTLTVPAAHAVPLRSHSPGMTSQSQLSQQDRVFLARVHQSNLTEIAAGKLAVVKGECVEVRELGALLVADHQEFDAEVMVVAARHGVLLPLAPSTEQIAQVGDLATRTGRDFDVAWLRFSIAAHIEALRLVEQEILHGQASDVRQLAVKAQPILQHHLEETEAVQKKCLV